VPQNDAGISLVAQCAPSLADAIAPTVAVSTPPLATLRATQTINWNGHDSGTGVANYDLRLSTSTYATALSAWNYPAAWQHTNKKTTTLSLGFGSNYCFQARARDAAGNTSPWSILRCVARALDDRSMRASVKFLRKAGTGFYKNTVTSSATLNATMTRTGGRLDRVGIVATQCATCGIVGVYVAGKLIGKINLYSPMTKRQKLLLLPRFNSRTGPIVVMVLTAGKSVQIDGLLISST